MAERKININRPEINPEEVAKSKDFEALLAKYKTVAAASAGTTSAAKGASFLSKWFLSGAITLSVGTASVIYYTSEKNTVKEEKVSMLSSSATTVEEKKMSESEVAINNNQQPALNKNIAQISLKNSTTAFINDAQLQPEAEKDNTEAQNDNATSIAIAQKQENITHDKQVINDNTNSNETLTKEIKNKSSSKKNKNVEPVYQHKKSPKEDNNLIASAEANTDNIIEYIELERKTNFLNEEHYQPGDSLVFRYSLEKDSITDPPQKKFTKWKLNGVSFAIGTSNSLYNQWGTQEAGSNVKKSNTKITAEDGNFNSWGNYSSNYYYYSNGHGYESHNSNNYNNWSNNLLINLSTSFIPYSSKKQDYNYNREARLGLAYYVNYASTDNRVELYTSTSSTQSSLFYNEQIHYLLINGAYFFRTNPAKFLSVYIGANGNLGISIKSSTYRNYYYSMVAVGEETQNIQNSEYLKVKSSLVINPAITEGINFKFFRRNKTMKNFNLFAETQTGLSYTQFIKGDPHFQWLTFPVIVGIKWDI